MIKIKYPLPVFTTALPTPSTVGNMSIRHAIGDQVVMTCIFNGLVRGHVNWTSPALARIQENSIYKISLMVSTRSFSSNNTLYMQNPVRNNMA